MPKIKPVSDLRNYNEVLKDVAVGETVFLTKNGRVGFAIIDIEGYEKNKATIMLLSKLMEAEETVKSGDGWLTREQVRNILAV